MIPDFVAFTIENALPSQALRLPLKSTRAPVLLFPCFSAFSVRAKNIIKTISVFIQNAQRSILLSRIAIVILWQFLRFRIILKYKAVFSCDVTISQLIYAGSFLVNSSHTPATKRVYRFQSENIGKHKEHDKNSFAIKLRYHSYINPTINIIVHYLCPLTNIIFYSSS